MVPTADQFVKSLLASSMKLQPGIPVMLRFLAPAGKEVRASLKRLGRRRKNFIGASVVSMKYGEVAPTASVNGPFAVEAI